MSERERWREGNRERGRERVLDGERERERVIRSVFRESLYQNNCRER